MTTITHKCPHCLTEHIALQVAAGEDLGNYTAVAHLSCPKCHMPSAALLDARSSNMPVAIWMRVHNELLHDWEIKDFWPSPPEPDIPDHVPDAVARALLQAERNYPTEGNEEAAGTMYRKALDLSLASFGADPKASLAKRIDKLAADGVLTISLKQWAHQIRLLGNESAHEEEPPTREELTALRNFSSLVMKYLFTLPKMVEIAKAADDNAKA